MGHELTPKTDRPALSTAEIIRRLQVSFVHVDEKISIDYESGMHEEVSRELRPRLVQILDDRIGLAGLIGRRMAPLAVVAFRTR